MEVLFYQTTSGRAPAKDELDALPKKAQAHAYELLEGIENYGLDAPRVIFRQIRGKLWEIKMKLPGVGGYRIFYCMIRKDIMLLLDAFSKKTQKAPKQHIEVALKRMADATERGL